MTSELNAQEVDQLIEKAKEAKSFAYAKYSDFRVGAALMTKDGQFIKGCNIENLTLTPTVCAERVALFKAISDGILDFKAIAVTSDDTTPIPPCGVCRQVLAEFVDDEFELFLTNNAGKTLHYRFADIFPLRFVPKKSIGKQAFD